MVWRSHQNGRKTGNSRVEIAGVFHLLHFCNGGRFFSNLFRIGFYSLDKRYVRYETTKRFRPMIWFEELQTRKKISRIFAVYEKTFPADERRNEEQFLSLLDHPDCFIFGVKNDDDLAGYVILWKCETFYFLEHFEVFEEFRNLKLGSQILSELKEKFSNIILESEPNYLDEMAERRIKFYVRNGFSIISENYIQPSYGEGKVQLNLFLLSNFFVENLEIIEKEIHSKVYQF